MRTFFHHCPSEIPQRKAVLGQLSTFVWYLYITHNYVKSILSLLFPSNDHRELPRGHRCRPEERRQYGRRKDDWAFKILFHITYLQGQFRPITLHIYHLRLIMKCYNASLILWPGRLGNTQFMMASLVCLVV